MAYTIAIDPGHGGRDPGAVFEGRQEKDDNLELALAVGQILEDNGIDVVYTRMDDVYNTPFEKATMANNSGADLFVSFHRNAMPTPGSASGAEVLVYEDAGVPAEVARGVLAELAEAGFTDRGVIERKNLVVLRRTQMPAVLLEVGFIDNPQDNQLLDSAFDEIAQGIAQGILDSIHVEAAARPENPQETLYRVQVGAFRESANAYDLLNQLLAEEFPAFIIYEDHLYRVQVGAFARLENAIRMEYTLRQEGYNTYITT
ncbi:MAG: N-acetylmuramoyl-L-alanine amidase [Lachnospiraceae bacterium]|nr:N-acetylmuramoyl-L-alanine amidase [Lachnospiraceae bacterium]